jgi:transposase
MTDFEKGQIISARLAGSSVTKTATLLGVSRTIVSKLKSAYTTHHGKTTSATRNSGRKSTLTDRNHRKLRRIVSKKNITTAAQVAEELNIHLEELVST